MTSGENKKAERWPALVSGLLAVVALSLTLLVFPTTWNPGLPLMLSGCLAIFVGLMRAAKGLGPYYRPESDMAMALLCWMAVCSLFTLDQYQSERYLFSFCGGVAFLFLCQFGIRTRTQWRGLCYCLLGVIGFASLLAWVPALIAASQTGSLPPLKGVFANHDTFAVLPLIGVCITMGLVEKSGPKLTVFNLLLAAFFLLTIFATGCRAALVGFVAAALVFSLPLHFLRKEKSEKTRLMVGFPLILCMLFTPVMGYQFSAGEKWSRVADGSAFEYQEMRFELIGYGYRAILENPIFGAGPGAFGQAYQTVRPPEHNELYVNIAHNDFLEVGVENGVLGLLLWLSFTWFGLQIPWSHLKKGRRPTEAAAVMSGVLALAVFSLFNFIIVQRPALWCQMWIFGLAYSFPSSRKGWEESKFVRVAAGSVLALFGLASLYWGLHSFQAEALYLEAEQAEQKLNLEEALELYDQATALESPRYQWTVRHISLLEKLRLFNGDNNLNRQHDILVNARKAHPRRVPILLKLAEVQQKLGKPEEARKSLDQAIKAAPYDRLAFSRRVTFLVEQGELKEAAEALAERTYWRMSENEEKFTGVLFALFQVQPNEGTQILQSWLKAHPDETGFSIPDKAASLAHKSEDWKAERSILKVWKAAQPDNLCLEERIAASIHNESGEAEEFSYLSSTLNGSLDRSDLCYSKLLERWSELGINLLKTDVVQPRLKEFLEVAPHRHWARAQLAKLMAAEKAYPEAVKLLRKGLDKNPNEAILLMALGDVFETQGSLELAVNYYREVTRKDPKNKKAKGKLKQLLQKL